MYIFEGFQQTCNFVIEVSTGQGQKPLERLKELELRLRHKTNTPEAVPF
jgi:hypothetical protein